MSHKSLSLKFTKTKVEIIDQTMLPFEEKWIDISNPSDAVMAIKNLKVRGAPLIGIAASLSLAIYCLKEENKEQQLYWLEELLHSRPTAVNLVHHLNEIKRMLIMGLGGEDIYEKALSFYNNDIEMCKKMAVIGSEALIDLVNKKQNINILTHCNTGALATAGEGTALAVIKEIDKKTSNLMVYADETRPLLQGARLTSWELYNAQISFKLICDNMAGFVMAQNKVDAIIVGADRITTNGDVANKIGTYSLAVLAKYHNIPFVIVAPTTTIDSSLVSGSEIPIEERDGDEIRGVSLVTNKMYWAKSEFPVYNPAFDWVPAELISGWVTEEGFFSNEDVKKGIFKNYQQSGVN